MSSSVKIPFILANAVAFHVSYTAPTAPAPKDERQPSPTMWERYLTFMIPLFPLMKAFFWLTAVSEIMIIVAYKFPGLSWLPTFMPPSFLLPTGPGADGVYMTLLSALGTTLIISGSLIRLRSYRTLERFFTYHITIRKNHRLVTTGPYSVVRHPAYTGTVINFLGLLPWFGARGAWLRESGVLSTAAGRMVVVGVLIAWGGVQVGMLKRAAQEDAILRNLFGKEWEKWARQVPYRVIPGLY